MIKQLPSLETPNTPDYEEASFAFDPNKKTYFFNRSLVEVVFRFAELSTGGTLSLFDTDAWPSSRDLFLLEIVLRERGLEWEPRTDWLRVCWQSEDVEYVKLLAILGIQFGFEVELTIEQPYLIFNCDHDSSGTLLSPESGLSKKVLDLCCAI